MAWIIRIDRHEYPGEPARLPGVHKKARGRPHEIGGRLGAIDQEETIRKFRRFDSHLVVEDPQLARGHGRSTVALRGEEISRKLLRQCWSLAAQQGAGKSQHTEPCPVRRQNDRRAFGHRQNPVNDFHHRAANKRQRRPRPSGPVGVASRNQITITP
jgi:hypothetical protein